MADKKPNLHKTLLILLVVFIPPFWLLFTDDGMRVSDNSLLWLLGEDEIQFNIAELDRGYTRQDIQEVFSDNEWHCGDKVTPFGNGLCAAEIGTFNGYPSRLLTIYFVDDHISAFKLIYRKLYHEQYIGYFIQQFGQPDNVAAAIADDSGADAVLEWELNGGVLLISKILDEGEPSFMWLAARPPTP